MLHQQIAMARVHTMRSVVNKRSHYTEYGAVSTAPEKSTTAHIIMSNNETGAKDILQNHGGRGGGLMERTLHNYLTRNPTLTKLTWYTIPHIIHQVICQTVMFITIIYLEY